MKTQALMSSGSYFPTEDAANEGSLCGTNCNVLLWIKLLFNGVRCYKVNILFLFCAMYHMKACVCAPTRKHIDTHSCRGYFTLTVCWCTLFHVGYLIWRMKLNSIKIRPWRRKKEGLREKAWHDRVWKFEQQGRENRDEKYAKSDGEGRSGNNPVTQTVNWTPSMNQRGNQSPDSGQQSACISIK